MTIHFASDHAGFNLKAELKTFLTESGYEIEDHGAHELDPTDDYNEYVRKAAEAVAEEAEGRAIILGGSGEGEAIEANRVPGVRAAVYYGGNSDIIRLSREHNDANVLSLGARFLSEAEAKDAVMLWLSTPFSGEARHERRNVKLG